MLFIISQAQSSAQYRTNHSLLLRRDLPEYWFQCVFSLGTGIIPNSGSSIHSSLQSLWMMIYPVWGNFTYVHWSLFCWVFKRDLLLISRVPLSMQQSSLWESVLWIRAHIILYSQFCVLDSESLLVSASFPLSCAIAWTLLVS